MPVRQQQHLKKYVLVRNRTDSGYIEFDFSIGDPNLYVELILPEAAFEDFCAVNQVAFLDDQAAQAIDADRIKWRQGDVAPHPTANQK